MGFARPAGKWARPMDGPCDPDPATRTVMKSGIHPDYKEVVVHCACGAQWTTKSVAKVLHLDICANCHPFFTGRQKLIDTEGRVERFTKRFGTVTAADRKNAEKAAKAAKAPKKASANA